jgi:hypothetical protein
LCLVILKLEKDGLNFATSDKVLKMPGSRRGIPNKSTTALAQKIEKIIPTEETVGLLAELARGVTIQEETKDGPRIYRLPPNHQALKTIMEYTHGKAKEFIEHSGEMALRKIEVEIVR